MSPLVDPVVHLVQPPEEVLRPDGLGTGDPHHVVAGMKALGLTLAAQVVVGADDALVAEAVDILVASVAGDALVLVAGLVAGLVVGV